jgi:hypothetical protein
MAKIQVDELQKESAGRKDGLLENYQKRKRPAGFSKTGGAFPNN